MATEAYVYAKQKLCWTDYMEELSLGTFMLVPFASLELSDMNMSMHARMFTYFMFCRQTN